MLESILAVHSENRARAELLNEERTPREKFAIHRQTSLLMMLEFFTESISVSRESSPEKASSNEHLFSLFHHLKMSAVLSMPSLFVKTYLFSRESSENTSHQVNVHVCDPLMPFYFITTTLFKGSIYYQIGSLENSMSFLICLCSWRKG